MTKYEKEKFNLFKNLRDNEEMAKQKITTLQLELDAQTAYFKQEEDKHDREI